jgi:hypothetical protein
MTYPPNYSLRCRSPPHHLALVLVLLVLNRHCRVSQLTWVLVHWRALRNPGVDCLDPHSIETPFDPSVAARCALDHHLVRLGLVSGLRSLVYLSQTAFSRSHLQTQIGNN